MASNISRRRDTLPVRFRAEEAARVAREPLKKKKKKERKEKLRIDCAGTACRALERRGLGGGIDCGICVTGLVCFLGRLVGTGRCMLLRGLGDL